MKIFCYIPEICLTDDELSSQVRRLLKTALAANIEPVGLPHGIQKTVVDLDEDQLKEVETLAKKHNLAKGRIVGGLLYAMHLAGTKESSNNEPLLNVDNLRPGQIRCLQEAAPFLRNGRIVLAESGTGTGKGRTIAHAAGFILSIRDKGLLPELAEVITDKDEGNKTPVFIREFASKAQTVRDERMVTQELKIPRAVIICAPSVENVSHLTREWATVRSTLDSKGLYSTALVLGRGQFVSPSQLAFMLEEVNDGTTKEISKWLEDGMPSGLTPATNQLKNIEPKLCGLMSDLEYLSNQVNFAHQNAALDEDCSDHEQSLYRELRTKSMNADIVFTTHAMLALDNMQLASPNAPGLLPCPAAVLIDEAHLFEGIQASIAAKSLSFKRLLAELKREGWKHIRKEAPAKAAISTATKAVDSLKDIADETPLPISLCGDPQSVKAWNAAQPELVQLRTDLQSLVKGVDTGKRSPKDQKQLRAIRYAQRCIAALNNITEGHKGFVGHSPIRGNISFTMGPASVSRYLAARWATTPTAMLLSGTLLYVGTNGSSSAAISRELAIPPERESSTTPIHPSWLVECPKLMMPAQEQFHLFVPPTGDSIDPVNMANWLRQCAKVVKLASLDAKGGMLVLMSGFDRLEGIAKALDREHQDLRDRLVVQSRTQRVSSCAAVFKEMARAGKRPIWLATGAAGTGLDLADDTIPDSDAGSDMLLTDLVIPNLPFGLDRTTTHMARVSKLGFGLEAVATQRRFRQWIGRLVRREGLKNRRIWLIDGRLQHPAALNYTIDFRRILVNYIHRLPFTVD